MFSCIFVKNVLIFTKIETFKKIAKFVSSYKWKLSTKFPETWKKKSQTQVSQSSDFQTAVAPAAFNSS